MLRYYFSQNIGLKWFSKLIFRKQWVRQNQNNAPGMNWESRKQRKHKWLSTEKSASHYLFFGPWENRRHCISFQKFHLCGMGPVIGLSKMLRTHTAMLCGAKMATNFLFDFQHPSAAAYFVFRKCMPSSAGRSFTFIIATKWDATRPLGAHVFHDSFTNSQTTDENITPKTSLSLFPLHTSSFWRLSFVWTQF